MSKEYERFVQQLTATLLTAQGLQTVEVRHDIKLEGLSGQQHQIDVYWEYRIAGTSHRVAIECKRYAKKVGLDIVRGFSAVLDDVKGLSGVIVTTTGFTRGAKRFAKANHIGLKIARKAKDADYEGRIRGIGVQLNVIAPPVVTGLAVRLDEAWLRANLAEPRLQALSDGLSIPFEESHIKRSGEVVSLRECISEVLGDVANEISGKYTHILRFDDAYVVTEEYGPLKLTELEISYTQSVHTEVFQVGGAEVAHTLISDAVSGTLLFVDDEGAISGDTEEEGIRQRGT